MPYTRPENTYVVHFRKKPETALARRTLVIMGILTVPIVVLHFMVPMKEDGVSLLGLWLLVLVVVLLQCRIWLHPINPDLQIQVDGDTFKVYRKGKWEDAHRFSEITKVRMYHPMQMGGKQIGLGKPQWEIYVGKECVAVFWAEMENSWKLDQKLRELGLLKRPH